MAAATDVTHATEAVSALLALASSNPQDPQDPQDCLLDGLLDAMINSHNDKQSRCERVCGRSQTAAVGCHLPLMVLDESKGHGDDSQLLS